MRGRACINDGELLGWFEVTLKWWQGCVLSSLPFNVSFAATLEIVLVRLSEVDIILKDIV